MITRIFINDSKVSDEDREKALVKIAGKKLNQYGENLIKLLIEFKRLNVLPEISHLFEILKATDEGTLDAEIIVCMGAGSISSWIRDIAVNLKNEH